MIKRNNSLGIICIGLLLILVISSCEHIKYYKGYYWVSNDEETVLNRFGVQELNQKRYRLVNSVQGLDDLTIDPIILEFEHESKVIFRYDDTYVLIRERNNPLSPQHYSITLPKGIKIALTNNQGEAILLYNKNQTVWIYDNRYKPFTADDKISLNRLLNLNDGIYELNDSTLENILNFNYLYAKRIESREMDNDIPVYANRYNTTPIRHIRVLGQDSISYSVSLVNSEVYFNNVFLLDSINMIGSVHPLTVNKNIVRDFHMPKIKQNRRNILVIKDGAFVLAYNILPKNFPIFKAMTWNTFQIHTKYARDKAFKDRSITH